MECNDSHNYTIRELHGSLMGHAMVCKSWSDKILMPAEVTDFIREQCVHETEKGTHDRVMKAMRK